MTLPVNFNLVPIRKRDARIASRTYYAKNNERENLGVAHFNCNRRKSNMTMKEWTSKHLNLGEAKCLCP